MSGNREFGHFYPAEKLLEVRKDNILLKNYSSLKPIHSKSNCKLYDKCEIINSYELSRAMNNYLEKISALRKKDEDISQVCQKIKKINNLSTVNCQSIRDTSIEKEIFRKETDTHNPIKDTTPENLSTVIKNIDTPNKSQSGITVTNPVKHLENWEDRQNNKLKDNVTVDDFLNNHAETHLKINERIFSEDQDKSQICETVQEDSSLHSSLHKRSTYFKTNEQGILNTENLRVKTNEEISDIELRFERPYICPKCQMAFKRKLHLKRHFTVIHTVNKNFKCDTCGKLFSRKDYLDKHISGHQKKNLKIKLLQQGIVVRTKIHSKSNIQ